MSASTDAISAAPTKRSVRPHWLRLPHIPFGIQILLGLAGGVALGLVARDNGISWLTTTLTQIGTIFVQLLKLAVPPLVFTAILVSVANLRKVANAARLALRTLFWFAVDDGPEPDHRALLAAVAVPTLVIHGTADPMFTQDHGMLLAESIPGAELLLLDGVGHQPPPRPTWDVVVPRLLRHTAGRPAAHQSPNTRRV